MEPLELKVREHSLPAALWLQPWASNIFQTWQLKPVLASLLLELYIIGHSVSASLLLELYIIGPQEELWNHFPEESKVAGSNFIPSLVGSLGHLGI